MALTFFLNIVVSSISMLFILVPTLLNALQYLNSSLNSILPLTFKCLQWCIDCHMQWVYFYHSLIETWGCIWCFCDILLSPASHNAPPMSFMCSCFFIHLLNACVSHVADPANYLLNIHSSPSFYQWNSDFNGNRPYCK